jgi:hypothetical protein
MDIQIIRDNIQRLKSEVQTNFIDNLNCVNIILRKNISSALEILVTEYDSTQLNNQLKLLYEYKDYNLQYRQIVSHVKIIILNLYDLNKLLGQNKIIGDIDYIVSVPIQSDKKIEVASTVICNFCNSEYKSAGLARHKKACKKNPDNASKEKISRKVSTSVKSRIAGKQNFKCANKPGKKIVGLDNFECPLWKISGSSQGSFNESGYEIDHIKEHSVTHDDSEKNLQALCLMCHSTKTKRFMTNRSKQNVDSD